MRTELETGGREAEVATKQKPTLSICIPTYNRPKELRDLLASISAEGDDSIDILIGDDSVDDASVAVVDDYRTIMPRVRYFKHTKNLGFDLNIQFLAKKAETEFIWFMGDDDAIEAGGVKAVRAFLSENPDLSVLIVGSTDYTRDLSTVRGRSSIPDTQLIDDLSIAMTKTATIIGFISTLIVSRPRWKAVDAHIDRARIQHLYPQVTMAYAMVAEHGRMGILNTPCVRFRTDNDQFLGTSWAKRMEIDAIAYDAIFSSFFVEDSLRFKLNESILRNHIRSRLINARLFRQSWADRLKMVSMLLRIYRRHPYLFVVLLPLSFAPRMLIVSARTGYQALNKSRRGRLMAPAREASTASTS